MPSVRPLFLLFPVLFSCVLLLSCGPSPSDSSPAADDTKSTNSGSSASPSFTRTVSLRSPLPDARAFHRRILNVMNSYPSDGTYGYDWPADESIHGVTRTLTYDGEVIARAGTGSHRNHTYCSGITFEVFFRAWRNWSRARNRPFSIGGMSAGELKRFRTLWYGADRSMSREKRFRTVQTAVVEMDMGTAVTDLERAEPGDFIQFWRKTDDGKPSGHTGIFLGWIRDETKRIRGVKYWSSQSSTDGIGVHREFMDEGPSPVDRDRIYLARVGRSSVSAGSDR